MHRKNLSLIIRHLVFTMWQKWLFFGLIGLAAAGLYIVVAPKDFEGQASLLVIQKYDQFADALSASRASDRLTKTLATASATSLFFQQVQDLGLSIGVWPIDERQRQKVWRRDVILKTTPDVSIMILKTYRPSQAEAFNLTQAVAQTLVDKGTLYHGGGESVSIRVVDAPQVSKTFARPDILLTLVFGFVSGALLVWVYFLLQYFFGKSKLSANFLLPQES
ncbi:MAG: hypothetical protein UV05_C0005G0013 [candidate division CPR1 bacterium GW2011_GWA2_42_17]|uniref:Polysaccharide chain length determinant N-terminal domain-containing protein n=1 Tax=candidate division CPR1 bacterium GW2011_GWA2_42_17 TaxID=1618341 RepID=A0A0G1BDQ9_9BACT|nr:MAG: hypothetical protein UV05_C0005G0013 [candidate division CPR1 bacterium GW2011_GWA2_42_17]